MRSVSFRLFCLLSVFVFGASLNEGGECETENVNGECLSIHNCDYAKNLLKANKRPEHCGFRGSVPLVCCPTSSNLQRLNPGKKSADNCKIYSSWDVRGFHYAFGGTPAQPREFAHMAILGYGDDDNLEWLCGATLISEEYVLTAAHCLSSQDLGDVKKVRLGDLDISSESDDAEPADFGIAKIFAHPNYSYPSHYNDIALIKLDRKVRFTSYIKPACLYTEYDVPPSPLVLTGWGQVDFFRERSSQLIKVNLDYINQEKCAKSYSNVSSRKLKNGIIEEIQVCAGAEDGRDACPGDSGGPLQVKVNPSRESPLHHSVVGVTSFGKGCGAPNSVGVYTRVAPFTEWIENIVWL